MAAKIGIVFLLFMLLQASLSLPISLDVKAVQSTDSVPESGLTERTSVLSSETILIIEEDNELVESLSTETLLKHFENFEADHGKRIKRDVLKPGPGRKCPNDTYPIGKKCLTQQQYDEFNSKEGTADSEPGRHMNYL